ncbi:hypothetical protein SAMN05216436_1222 [bacterium A37T11]|nr:hypothetical protein SAMN05216436_1222 [bacterium A37T11]
MTITLAHKLSLEDEQFLSSLGMRLNNRLVDPSAVSVKKILSFARSLK